MQPKGGALFLNQKYASFRDDAQLVLGAYASCVVDAMIDVVENDDAL